MDSPGTAVKSSGEEASLPVGHLLAPADRDDGGGDESELRAPAAADEPLHRCFPDRRIDGKTRHAMTSWMTRPCTSVRRKSRPL